MMNDAPIIGYLVVVGILVVLSACFILAIGDDEDDFYD